MPIALQIPFTCLVIGLVCYTTNALAVSVSTGLCTCLSFAIMQRIVRMFEAVNFKEFVRLLAAFSSRAERDDRLAFMFAVYDVDGDGGCCWRST